MITRSDYMQDSSNLHHVYYAQFITPATRAFIENNIGLEKLLTSKDEHLNDLYKHSRGGAGTWIWDSTPINMALLKELGEPNSMATHTCVGKAYAKIMIAEYKGQTL